MSDEDRDKIINFLIHRQEVFAENLERMEGVVGRLAETVGVLVESQKQLTDSHIQTQRDISFLAQALTQLARERGEERG